MHCTRPLSGKHTWFLNGFLPPGESQCWHRLIIDMLDRTRCNSTYEQSLSRPSRPRRDCPGRRQWHQRHSSHDWRLETDVKLLADLGTACAAYQDRTLRNLTCRRIQCDEICQFCYAKQKNVPTTKNAPDGAGDIWTWVALDADTKLVPSWLVAGRDLGSAYTFMHDLADRLTSRVQLTTDGYRLYLEAVESAFYAGIDYAMLHKLYGATDPEHIYSPAQCTGFEVKRISGHPNPRHISTSYVERQNLTMRMSMKRFARLSNRFSKKVENHVHAVAIHYMHYNFARIHKSLRTTPAQAAGVTERLWEIADIVQLLDRIKSRAA